MPMRHAFLTQSLHDPALFHTFLSHYSASFHTSYSLPSNAKSDPDEAIYHRTMAIKIVNERIRERKDELSDGSVGAVANLAIYEVWLFHLKACIGIGFSEVMRADKNIECKWNDRKYASPSPGWKKW
jgi:hypothetical protein